MSLPNNQVPATAGLPSAILLRNWRYYSRSEMSLVKLLSAHSTATRFLAGLQKDVNKVVLARNLAMCANLTASHFGSLYPSLDSFSFYRLIACAAGSWEHELADTCTSLYPVRRTDTKGYWTGDQLDARISLLTHAITLLDEAIAWHFATSYGLQTQYEELTND